MKTHDFAKQLTLMAKLLRAGGNIEMSELDSLPLISRVNKSNTVNYEDIPQALNMLVNLNRVGKQQWLDLIDDFNFDVPIRTRDGNRDIMGKLLNFLTVNPEARDKLQDNKSRKNVNASAELASALTTLLK